MKNAMALKEISLKRKNKKIKKRCFSLNIEGIPLNYSLFCISQCSGQFH